MSYTTVNKSTDYFNTKLWNGNSSTQAITGVGFAPDFVWGKQRTGVENHQLLDVIRGVNNILVSNNDTGNTPDTNILNSFDSDGFTLGNQNQLNDTGATYVGWNWKANGAGSANTDGTINTAYTSANTTSGFSISKFVGTGSNATVGHGLGVAPKMVIVKSLSSGNWSVYHGSLGGTKAMFLDLTGTVATHIDYWNNTDPTSSVFSIGTSSNMNHNGQDMIAYCFADVQGFSKAGSYTGNGNANGTFVYTGFKPAWIMTRATDIGGGTDWYVFDNKRPAYNLTNLELQPNNSGIESSDIQLDILSNGFKPRGSQGGHNGNGNNYIYLAFAEAPLVGTNNVPATAR